MYIFELMNSQGKYDETERIGEISEAHFRQDRWVMAEDLTTHKHHNLRTFEEFEEFLTGAERAFAWKPRSTDTPAMKEYLKIENEPEVDKHLLEQVEAKHYENFIDEYEWIDAESRTPQFRDDPDGFCKGLLLTIRGYISRLGLKNVEHQDKDKNIVQDLLKARWYLEYLIAYYLNGKKPILAKDVETIIKKALGHN